MDDYVGLYDNWLNVTNDLFHTPESDYWPIFEVSDCTVNADWLVSSTAAGQHVADIIRHLDWVAFTNTWFQLIAVYVKGLWEHIHNFKYVNFTERRFYMWL